MSRIKLISSENIPRVHLVLDIIQTRIVSVGYNGLALPLEFVHVIDDPAAEEGAPVLKRRLVDDDFRTFCLDALHHALYRGLAEVVGVRLHGETIHADDAPPLVFRTEVTVVEVVVVSGPVQHLVRDEVLSCPVAFDYGLDEVLRDIGVVGQELLGVFREAVAAVAEARIVVVTPDAGIETHSIDDITGVQPLDFSIGIEFIEVADPQREVGVCEQLDSLGLSHSHVQCRYVLLECPFLKHSGEGLCGIQQTGLVG